MKLEEILHSDSSTTNGGFLRVAGSKRFNDSNYPPDEEISKIAAMPLEEIKRQLTQMGALDIPIPRLLALSNSRKAASTSETDQGQSSSMVWSSGNLTETRFWWLRSKAPSPLRLGMSLMALATLMLIVSNGALLDLLIPQNSAAIPAAIIPDSFGVASSDGVGTEANSVNENLTAEVGQDRPSRQQTSGGRRKTERFRKIVAQLEKKGSDGIHPENRNEYQPPLIADLRILGSDIRPVKDPIEGLPALMKKVTPRSND